MYSTCLFCTRPLGTNEALESFPVGRRLAFDPAKGRLWVVCQKCERWNLSPLETRWEAIEDAERAYRGAALKVSTDNIGLAQLSEGLELVRLGNPPRPEFAAWRYGDQFGRRRIRNGASLAVMLAAAGAPLVLDLAHAAAAGTIVTWVWLFAQQRILRRDQSHARFFAKSVDGRVLPMTGANTRGAALIPKGSHDEWLLRLDYVEPDHLIRSRPRRLFLSAPDTSEIVLDGPPALAALSAILPHLNRGGGGGSLIRRATAHISEAKSIDQLVLTAATSKRRLNGLTTLHPGNHNVGAIPNSIRLALEMALHEDDERRAMEGELALLEARWRDAEEIAAIADSLTLPPTVDEKLAELKAR